MLNGISIQKTYIRCGENMINLTYKRKWSILILFFSSLLYTNIASGIDNPDAPDYKGIFLIKAAKYEKEILQGCTTNKDYTQAYTEYEIFLNRELKNTYDILLESVDKDAREALIKSQQEWLEYQNSTFEFIALNWRKETFGSSSLISRGDYRTTIVKNRIILLCDYLKNYQT